MLLKLNVIIIYALIAFFLALVAYPIYIRLLRKWKAGKHIRVDTVTGENASIFASLHGHKAGTPTMGGGLILLILLILVLLSLGIQELGRTNHSLLSRQETYIILFGIFSTGILGLVDDYLNIQGKSGIKGLTANIKFVWMFGFSAFISYWFYVKLGVDYVTIWPLLGQVDIGIWYPIITFVLTVGIVNAINITDGLDGLVGGLMLIILSVLGIMTFMSQRYLATTIIGIVIGTTGAFLRYNINPAKIFMGDSGSLAFGGLVASLVYLLNIRFGILLPFVVLFAIFWVEVGSSFLQIMWKKIFNKKLFTIAPFHHALEHKGMKEHSIVMKLWMIQGILAAIALLGLIYQI